MTAPPRTRTPRGQVKPFMASFHEACDRAMAELIAGGAQHGLNLVCRPGCTACCTYLAHTFEADAILVVDAVQGLPRDTRQAVIDRLVAWVIAWKSDPTCSADPIAEHEATRVHWGRKRIQCPMLDPEHRTCLVYEHRPLVCRSMHAVDRANDRLDPACPACPDLSAPVACLVDDQHVAHGHEPYVWQLRNDITPTWDVAIIQLFGRLGIDFEWLRPGPLAVVVLEQGARLYGWKAGHRVALPMFTGHPT